MEARLKTFGEIKKGTPWEPVKALESDYCFITLLYGTSIYWSIGFERYKKILEYNQPRSASQWAKFFPTGTPHAVIENFLKH